MKSSLFSGSLVFRLIRKHITLLAIVLFQLLSGSELAAGQTEQRDPRNDPYSYKGSLSPAIAVVVIVVIAALFLMGFFTVYIRHFTGASFNPAGGMRRVTNSAAARGLDASTIEAFPSFVYSEVKTQQKIGKGALECAICLNEFEDDETLRLLPICDHVFHSQCIGAWLIGHVTCPVCRKNLAEEQQLTKPVEPEVLTEMDIEAQQLAVPELAGELGGSIARVKFSRSHTTGHSVVLPGENSDRFTLRLPEDLRKKIVANWKMNRSNSLLILPMGRSSWNDKPVDPSMAQSDRWFFRKTPSFLWRSREDGSIRQGGTGCIKVNAIAIPTSDSVRTDRWTFLRNHSFLWRNTPVQSSRVEDTKDGEEMSSVQHTGTSGLASGSVRFPV